MSTIGSALKVAQLLGSIGTVATLGEVVGKRVGLIDKGTNLLTESANMALDVLGAPKDSAIRPGAQSPQLPEYTSGHTVGEVSEIQRDPRIICVDCQRESDMPLLAGSAGEEIVLGQCRKHYDQNIETQGLVGAMYEGWGKSFGLGQSSICVKPDINSQKYKYHKKVGNKIVLATNSAAYYADQVEYQKCLSAEKDAAATAAKAQSAAAKKASFALAAQRRRYQSEIDKLKAQQAAEKDEAAKAETQAKIDAATAAKETAEKLADELRRGAADAATQAKIDALQATISSQASKPGGMDQFMQALMLQMISQRQAPPAAPAADPFALMLAQQQAQVVDPLSMLAPAVQLPVPVSAPGTVTYDEDGSGYDYFMSGDDDAPMDSEVADLLGFHGARTLGEARALFDLRHGGNYADDELDAALESMESDPTAVSGCSIGACGVLQG